MNLKMIPKQVAYKNVLQKVVHSHSCCFQWFENPSGLSHLNSVSHVSHTANATLSNLFTDNSFNMFLNMIWTKIKKKTKVRAERDKHSNVLCHPCCSAVLEWVWFREGHWDGCYFVFLSVSGGISPWPWKREDRGVSVWNFTKCLLGDLPDLWPPAVIY